MIEKVTGFLNDESRVPAVATQAQGDSCTTVSAVGAPALTVASFPGYEFSRRAVESEDGAHVIVSVSPVAAHDTAALSTAVLREGSALLRVGSFQELGPLLLPAYAHLASKFGQFSMLSAVAYLDSFYPHGDDVDHSNNEFARRGLGSFVLELLMSDEMAAAAEAVFSLPTSDSMRNFLQKQGFRPISGPVPLYYKVLRDLDVDTATVVSA